MTDEHVHHDDDPAEDHGEVRRDIKPWTVAHLTPAQSRVLLLRAWGLSVGEVALRLGLALSTVKNYILAIYRALEVDNLADALRAVGWLLLPDLNLEGEN